MILKFSVLVAAVAQVVGAAYLSIGTFEQSERVLPVFIQPAGWAFSIWGLIYSLSLIYAIYQIIPKYDNQLLRATRLPALIAFLGSIAWLYFAGMEGGMLWLTIPVLFLMAIALTKVVTATETSDTKQTILSKKVLLPYAAWTGIASWLNVQAVLSEQSVINSEVSNYLSNGILFLCIAIFTLTYFKKSGYSAWYGGVLVWAGVAVVYANLTDGNIVFAVLGGLLAVVTAGLYIKYKTTK